MSSWLLDANVLLALAHSLHHRGYVATFDKELVSTFPKVAHLISWSL